MIYKRATKEEFIHCFAIRYQVFVLEQGFKIDEEVDNLDECCIHYLAIDNDKYVATLRVFINNNDGHIGRVCVLKEERNKHIGYELMKFVESDLSFLSSLSLGAQIDAKPFYERLGFHSFGEPFIEGNILHINMKKELNK